MFAMASGADAASFNVAAGTDTIAVDGECGLSESIENINDQSVVHSDCPAGNGADIINLPEGIVTLSSPLPSLENPASIIGQGRDKSFVDGNSNNSLFRYSMIGFDSVADFEIKNFSASNVSMSAGGGSCIELAAPGGISPAVSIENIDLNNCGRAPLYGFCDCSTGSISVSVKSVNISNGTRPEGASYGVIFGGLASLDMDGVSVQNTLFGITLSASKSGGDYSIRNMTVTNTYLGLLIAGVTNQPSVKTMNVVLENNTIALNHADQASDRGPDFTDGGSGLVLLGGESSILNISMTNNLIVDNTVNTSTLSNCTKDDTGGPVNITSGGGNMADDDCGGMFGSGDNANTSGISEKLGPLQNNGGEVLTMALLEGSGAIDGGVTISSVLADARGTSRPQRSGYDVGAYEAGVATSGGGGSSSTPTPPRTGVVLGFTAIGLAVILLLSAVAAELGLMDSLGRKKHSR